MEKVNEYKFELACCIALSAVGVNFWRELQVIGINLNCRFYRPTFPKWMDKKCDAKNDYHTY